MSFSSFPMVSCTRSYALQVKKFPIQDFFLTIIVCISCVDLSKVVNGNLEKTHSCLVLSLGGRHEVQHCAGCWIWDFSTCPLSFTFTAMTT